MGKPETADREALATGDGLDAGWSEDQTESVPTLQPLLTADTEAIDSEWPSDGRVGGEEAPGATFLKVPSYPLPPRLTEEGAPLAGSAEVHPTNSEQTAIAAHSHQSEDLADATKLNLPLVRLKASAWQGSGEADEEAITPLATAIEPPLGSPVLAKEHAWTAGGLTAPLVGGGSAQAPMFEDVTRTPLALRAPSNDPRVSPLPNRIPIAHTELEPETLPTPQTAFEFEATPTAPVMFAEPEPAPAPPAARGPEPLMAPPPALTESSTQPSDSAAVLSFSGQAELTSSAETTEPAECGTASSALEAPALSGPTNTSPLGPGGPPISHPVAAAPAPGMATRAASNPLSSAPPKPARLQPMAVAGPAPRAVGLAGTAQAREQPLTPVALDDVDLRHWADSVKPKRRWGIAVTLVLAVGGAAAFLLRPGAQDELEGAIRAALSAGPSSPSRLPEPPAASAGSLPAPLASGAPAISAPTPSASAAVEAPKSSAVSGPRSVSIDTTPPRALVFQGTRRLGKSPLEIKLEAGETVNLLIAYDGHQPQKIQVDGSQPKLSLTLVPYQEKDKPKPKPAEPSE